MKILVVDDERDSGKTLQRIMDRLGQCDAVDSGEDALRIATSEDPPDLILLDVMMPGMDGYEVCRTLKTDKRASNIPVIFISGLVEEEDETKGLGLAAVDYITKPFSPAIVQARVRTHLELKKHRDQIERLVKERTAELTKANEQLTAEIEERKRVEEGLRAASQEQEATCRDLEEHIGRANQMAVEAEYARLEVSQIFNAAGDGMWVVDTDFNVVRANKAFSALSGKDQNELVGRKCYDVFPGSLCRGSHCPMSQLMTAGERFESDMERRLENGAKIPFILTATRFQGLGDEMVGIVESFKDVTERKRAEEASQKAKEDTEAANCELIELNELKNRLLGVAAHDLRNPLSSIRGLSEMLLDEGFGPLTEEQDDFLRTINSTSDEMLTLVNDLLDVSVIESGRLELQLKKGSLAKLVEDRTRIHKVIAGVKNITIHTELHDVPDMLFDSSRIAQVFDNLVSNAIKFSPTDLNVYVTVDQEDSMARVSVRDEGPGITDEDKSKLFGEFQRLSARPTGGEKSTGLGLSIAKKIIESHKGILECHSQPGSGCTFTFALPTGGNDQDKKA
jgi:PAS domain S-box-containing protein